MSDPFHKATHTSPLSWVLLRKGAKVNLRTTLSVNPEKVTVIVMIKNNGSYFCNEFQVLLGTLYFLSDWRKAMCYTLRTMRAIIRQGIQEVNQNNE